MVLPSTGKSFRSFSAKRQGLGGGDSAVHAHESSRRETQHVTRVEVGAGLTEGGLQISTWPAGSESPNSFGGMYDFQGPAVPSPEHSAYCTHGLRRSTAQVPPVHPRSQALGFPSFSQVGPKPSPRLDSCDKKSNDFLTVRSSKGREEKGGVP